MYAKETTPTKRFARNYVVKMLRAGWTDLSVGVETRLEVTHTRSLTPPPPPS